MILVCLSYAGHYGSSHSYATSKMEGWKEEMDWGSILQMAIHRSKRCAAILQLPKASAARSAKLVSINGSCFFGLCTFVRLGKCSCAGYAADRSSHSLATHML